MSGLKNILGGGSSKQTTTQKSTNTQKSFLLDDPKFKNAVSGATGDIANINIMPDELASMPPEEQAALQNLMKGENYDFYKGAQGFMSNNGTNLYNSGTGQVNQATDIIQRLQGISPDQMRSMIKENVNTGLLNDQIAGLKSDVNDTVMQNLHGIDQTATSTGNVGSSRAGVMSGVAIGQGAKAVATGTLQLRTNAENTARQDLYDYLNRQSSTAGQLAQIGSNQQQTGLTMYGQSVGYGQNYVSGQLQNSQNAVNAGNMEKSYQQQQIEMERQRALYASSPALQRLGVAMGVLGPVANLSQTSTGTVNQTTNTPSSGGGLLSAAGAIGGMWAGNNGYLSFMGGTGAQQQQAGGMFGAMAGNTISQLF